MIRLAAAVIAAACLWACSEAKEQPAPPAQPVPPPAPRAVIPEGTPPGSIIEFEFIADGGSASSREQASSIGAGAEAVGQKITDGFDGSAPGVALAGGTSGSGGSASRKVQIVGLESAARSPLLWVGLAVAAAGLACLYLGLRRAGLYCLAAGGACVVAAMLPAWGWVALAIAGAAGLGLYLYAEWGKANVERAATQIIKGIEAAPKPVRSEAKRIIGQTMRDDPRAVRTVERIKDAKRLPREKDRE